MHMRTEIEIDFLLPSSALVLGEMKFMKHREGNASLINYWTERDGNSQNQAWLPFVSWLKTCWRWMIISNFDHKNMSNNKNKNKLRKKAKLTITNCYMRHMAWLCFTPHSLALLWSCRRYLWTLIIISTIFGFILWVTCVKTPQLIISLETFQYRASDAYVVKTMKAGTIFCLDERQQFIVFCSPIPHTVSVASWLRAPKTETRNSVISTFEWTLEIVKEVSSTWNGS